MTDCYVCCCCGEDHGLDDIKEVQLKGKTKKICTECVTAIKGLV